MLLQNMQQMKQGLTFLEFNPLTPELNPSAQRCLTRYFTGDLAS
jgi:hypothetical protein